LLIAKSKNKFLELNEGTYKRAKGAASDVTDVVR
jgi:hypothetical protein